MTSAIDSHLRDLENELRDADRDVEEYRERSQRRIETMNTEIAELVKKVQFEKAAIKEQRDRKELWAKRKFDEVHAFKETLFSTSTPGLTSASSAYQTSSSRPSTLSEPTKPSIASIEETTNGGPAKTTEVPDAGPDLTLVNGVLHDNAGWYNGYKYLPELGIVCRRPNGTWCEIRCYLCGGNWIDKKGWIRGGRGMLAHCTKSHKIDYYSGEKLDSVNIIEICLHQNLTYDDVNSCLAGTMKFDIIPCRDMNSVAQDQAPPRAVKSREPVVEQPVVPKEPSPQEKKPQPEDRDMPYDWLAKYPTIVMRRDGQWVELRCDVCKGNSLANSDKRFAQGVIGFVRHLSRGHNIKPPVPSMRLEWTVKRCEFRVVPPEDVLALTEETGAAIGPAKIPFQQTVGEKLHIKRAGSKGAAVPAKRRASKRDTDPIESDDSDDTVEVNGSDDDDFNPAGDASKRRNSADGAKRARYSMSSYSPKGSGRGPKKARKGTMSLTASPTTSTAKHDGALDGYCPCTINSHPCESEECKKTKICIKANHDSSCMDGPMSHATKSNCVMAILSQECPDGDSCQRGHDHLEERKRKMLHECKSH